MMHSKDLVFSAEIETDEPTLNLSLIPVGSVLEVTGVCFTESDRDKKLQSLQMLLPGPGSIRILKKPSWWTPHRLLIGLAALFGFLIVAVSWTVMVSKKNSRLNVLIKEKEIAQEELQQAHDHLEERVRERTEQLKFQITARKESELQFKAVLSERTRLAQELHDTLEQTLTGIALQLDTAARLSETNTDHAHRHVELARTLVAQSQVDVRRSVWDLRSRALEQFDLPGALLTSSKHLSDGTSVRFEVSTKGRVRPLPETIEENLLRIAQEAMTNVIKHSGASRVDIELNYGPQRVGLTIRDNGRGFQTNTCAGPSDGHFGLLGISERAKRLRGEARILSAAGEGTAILVQIPIEPEISSALAEMTLHHES
jgi:signal transduction histidine kinase